MVFPQTPFPKESHFIIMPSAPLNEGRAALLLFP